MLDVERDARFVHINFGGRGVGREIGELDEMFPACAIAVHQCQG